METYFTNPAFSRTRAEAGLSRATPPIRAPTLAEDTTLCTSPLTNSVGMTNGELLQCPLRYLYDKEMYRLQINADTKNDESTVVQHARPQQEAPAKVDHHKAAKPQAATSHQLNGNKSPEK